MTLLLGCIADDYTGASDLANTLTRNGLRTVQTIGVPDQTLKLDAVDAVVVSLKSRSIQAAAAVAACEAAARWLRAQGAGHILFKICSTFDSTDAGNIGPVTNALRNGSSVLVTPAFPATGRTVYQGHLFVHSMPLHESPLKDHPLNPMRDSNLVRVLARQSGETGIGLIAESTVAGGAEAILASQAELARAGFPVAIIDAVFERDLEAIGIAALHQPLSVGASGLGLGLARALVATGRAEGKIGEFAGAPVGGHAACLVGSCSQATLEQIAREEAEMPVLRLDTESLFDNGAVIEQAVAWAAERLTTGPILIASSAAPAAVAALQARHGGERAGRVIEQSLAAIAAGLVDQGVRRLAIGGGETAGAIIDRLAIPAFAVGAEIAPGVPLLRGIGPGPGMMVALKSGNFGGPDFFSRAIGMMQ
jgi:uncharacterized protein YgbK (DUF1537 family)